MTLRGQFRVLMIGIVSVPAVTATLLAVLFVLLSSESESVRRIAAQRIWVNDALIPRLETVDFTGLTAPEGALVMVLDPEQEIVLFSSIPGVEAGSRPEPGTEPDLPGPPQDDFTFFLELVRNSQGRTFQIAQAFPIALQRELFRRARSAMIVLAVFIGMTMLGAIGGNIAIGSFRRKLTGLRESIRSIARGNLEAKVPIEGQDELAQLAHDIDTTRIELKEERAKRSRFLMSVSHDLKTPLTTIRGYLEAIDDGLAGDEATMEQYLSVIRGKSELLESRILELIEFVRMETGEWRMQNEHFSLAEFLQRTSAIFAEDAAIHSRTYRATIDLAPEVTVLGDATLLSRVFENLFHNALRYTNVGDSITLTVVGCSDGSITIKVDDTGPGFGDSDPEKLFEPLARGSNSRQEPGFGLGLATARSIVGSHGWTIDARNGETGGASFRIAIPALRVEHAGAAKSPTTNARYPARP